MDQVLRNGMAIDPALGANLEPNKQETNIYQMANNVTKEIDTSSNHNATSQLKRTYNEENPNENFNTNIDINNRPDPRVSSLQQYNFNLDSIQNDPRGRDKSMDIPVGGHQQHINIVPSQVQSYSASSQLQIQESVTANEYHQLQLHSRHVSFNGSPPMASSGPSGSPSVHTPIQLHMIPSHLSGNSPGSMRSISNGNSPRIITTPNGKVYRKNDTTPGHNTNTRNDETMDDLRHLALGKIDDSVQDILKHDIDLQDQTERSKQLLGIIIILKTCQISMDSAVPRNRIFAKYASICANNHLKPLGQAAFGKLVKGIFPDITTRRLGTRGQSKYHYCGIRLIDNEPPQAQPENHKPTRSITPLFDLPYIDSTQYDSLFINPLGSASPPLATQMNLNNREFIQKSYDPLISMTPKVKLTEAFANISMVPHVIQKIVLRPIEPFISQTILQNNQPTISSLIESYTNYCNELAEALRFLHIKKFFQLVESYHKADSALTRNLEQVFWAQDLEQFGDCNSNTNVFDIWIISSDLDMYKEMLKMISPLALQNVPSQVLTALENISCCIVENFTKILQNWIKQMINKTEERYNKEASERIKQRLDKFLEMKLKSISKFANLISGLVRVNETALAAGKILSNPIDLEVMLGDWVKLVDFNMIIYREINCEFGEAKRKLVLELLTKDVIDLLKYGIPEDKPVVESMSDTNNDTTDSINGNNSNNDNEIDQSPVITPKSKEAPIKRLGSPMHDGKMSSSSFIISQISPSKTKKELSSTHPGLSFSEEVILKWAQFLSSIPLRFSDIHVRIVILYLNNLVTSILRDITLNGGSGFGAWWIVRCWIDEWLTWAIEKESFLQFNFSLNDKVQKPNVDENEMVIDDFNDVNDLNHNDDNMGMEPSSV